MNTQRIKTRAWLRKPVAEMLSERRANVFYTTITVVTLLISACVAGGDEPTRGAFRPASAQSSVASNADAVETKGSQGRSAQDSGAFASPYQPSAEEYRAMAIAEYIESF